MNTTTERELKHRQLFDQISAAIARKSYIPGQKLPSETQLMRQFNVSRTTVIRALRDLETAGLIRRKQGAGTFVAEQAELERGPGLAFFAPFAESGSDLPYVEGQIYQQLAHFGAVNLSQVDLHCLPPGNAPFEKKMNTATEAILNSSVKGVLYYPAELPAEQMYLNTEAVNRLTDAGRTVILIDRDIVSFPDRSKFTRIGYDNRRGGYLLADHLFQGGCRRIAFVGIPEVSTAATDRQSGYFDALRDHGIASDKRLVSLVDEEDLTEAFCRQLLEEGKPDAIIGKCDRFAALIGRHLMTLERKIGEDIMLAGFGDGPIAQLFPVPLTTIRLPVKPFAEAAFQAVTLRVQDKEICSRQLIIDTELVVRESTSRATE